MLEDKISKKRKELDESIKNNKKYDYVYKLSTELDDLITEFYKKSIRTKTNKKVRLKHNKNQNKILYIA